MTPETQRKVIRGLVVLLLVLQVTLMISVYVISALHGYLQFPKIYISHALKQDPTRAIASFILPICAFIITIVVGHRLYFIHSHIRTSRDRWLWWFTCGALTSLFVGMLGVAAVSIPTHMTLHWLSATFLFMGGSFLTIGSSLMDHFFMIDIPVWLRNLRCTTAALTLAVGVVFMSMMSVNSAVAAIAEMAVSALYVGYFVTLAHGSSFPITSIKMPRSPRPSSQRNRPTSIEDDGI